MLATGTRAHRAAGASTGAASAARATSACRASGDTCDRCDARDVLLSRSLGAMKHKLRAEEKRVQAWLVRMHLALHMRAILRIGVRAMPTQADEGDCWRCAARRCAQ